MKPHTAAQTLAVVLLVLFAGCLGPGDGTPAAAPSPTFEAAAAEVSTDLGAVQGHALDESLLPLPNATIRLEAPQRADEPPLETLADVTGAFTFSFLRPDTYRLVAAADGYRESASFVQVRPQEVTRIDLVLTDKPSEVPYHLVFLQNDYLSCSMANVFLSQGWKCEWYLEGRSYGEKTTFEIPEGWRAVVTETTWATEDYLTDYLWKWSPEDGETAGEYGVFYAIGQAPLRGTLFPNVTAMTTGVLCCTPPPEGNFTLNHLNQFAGRYADEFDAVLHDPCKEVNGDRCGGAGFTLDLRFSIYLSVFVNGVPADLDAYTAMPDA